MSLHNKLVLSLGHRPLKPDLLNKIIDETTSEANRKLANLQDQVDQLTASENHAINSNNGAIGYAMASEENLNPTVHVLLTGSPQVTKPGRSFDDWETKWTAGEKILSKFIDKIGLQNFHRLPKDGEARMNGKLVDVKQNDFSNSDSASTQLKRELSWIATNVAQHFNLYAKSPVSEATILYPVDDHCEINERELSSMIMKIYNTEWSEKKGPLNGVKVNIRMVS